MAELVDAPDSKSSSRKGVRVRFPLRPPEKPRGAYFDESFFDFFEAIFMMRFDDYWNLE